jgi:hypothetical protein
VSQRDTTAERRYERGLAVKAAAVIALLVVIVIIRQLFLL